MHELCITQNVATVTKVNSLVKGYYTGYSGVGFSLSLSLSLSLSYNTIGITVLFHTKVYNIMLLLLHVH